MNKFVFVLLFAFALLTGGFFGVGAQTASFVTHQSNPSIGTLYGSQASTYWPILDNPSQCNNRQDILLKIAPLTCQPAVVRSDLLAEQNVPVFCQIDGLNINPLLDISGIRNIRFTGQYPVEVAGVSYHPAQAALKSSNNLIGSPGINNMGYVVVVLKQNANESSLPDSVEVNLSAQLEYSSGNAYGVGNSEFKLKEQTLDEFKAEKSKQSFWDGRYSLRLVKADSENAQIEVWEGDFKRSDVSVKKGERGTIYVPGSYCQAAFDVEYTGFESNDKRAKVEISDDSGSDVLWVYEGSRFLNDKCTVRDISVNENGDVGSLRVNCGQDDLSLSIGARENGTTISDITFSDSGAEDAFNNAIVAYEKVASDFPRERESLADGSLVYGEDALVRAIDLARNTNGKEATEARLLREFIETYPDSARAEVYQSELNDLGKLDMGSSGNVVLVDNRYRTIRVLGFEAGPQNAPEVVFSRSGLEKQVHVGLRETSSEFGTDSDLTRVEVEEILSEDQASVRVWCRAGANEPDKDKVITMNLNSRVSNVCSGVDLRVDAINNFDPVASVKILPEAQNTQSEASLSVSVGIEKRAIKLSTDKIHEKLDNLNKSVEKWEKLSDNLGGVVSGMKTACFATSAALIAKNFVSGTDGTAQARQEAMNGVDGWKAKCSDEVARGSYVSMSACFIDKKTEIESEVSARAKAISETDKLVNNIQVGKDVSVYDDEYNKKLIAEMRQKYGDSVVNEYIGTGDDASNYVSHSELRDLAYNLELKKNGLNVNDELGAIKDRIQLNQNFYNKKIDAQNNHQLEAVLAPTNKGQAVRAQFYDVSGGKVGGLTTSLEEGVSLKDGDKAVLVYGNVVTGTGQNTHSEPGNYLVVGDGSTGELSNPKAIYGYENNGGTISLSKVEGVNADKFLQDNGITSFREYPSNFNNEISPTDRFVRYFGTGPDSGSAAVVPFDVNHGWYARVVSVSTEIPAYDSSGMPKTWEVCNVGGDGRIDAGDDCQIIFSDTAGGVPVLGLSDTESRDLIDKSRRALLDANSQKGNKVVRIAGEVFDQGPLYSHYDSAQCQDFMSIDDCQLLFNVCDPVICPTSRCDLGGQYPVSDVIQTGIVGSAVLCLPNFVGFGGDVAVPVCLSGIKSGIDGYVSILKSHEQCLQESLDTGQQIGICDQISSVYMCDFFWRQITPVAKEVLPALVSGSYNGFGRATRGGGEYSSLQAAFDNTDKAINYFTQTYAANSFEAFRARSIEDAGTEFCKAFVSVNVPTDFETLVAPDSPPQYYAWFSSETFSDVTVPATAQYKVFYHIYAGENFGATFSVYMKDPPSAGLVSVPSRIDVASGYINRGGFATDSVDFTAPEGYKQLCVLVNGEEECGFKQVSTSFALNYLADSAVSNQITANDITTTEGCISGTTSPAALLNPNIQAGAQEALTPEVYNRGIVRVCATTNPGQGTDPTRFVDVGYCDDKGLTCWLDKNSVENAISTNDKGIANETLQTLESMQNNYLSSSDGLNEEEGNAKIKSFKDAVGSLKDSGSAKTLAEGIDGAYGTIYFNYQKAAILELKAQALQKVYEFISRKDLPSLGGSNTRGSMPDNTQNDTSQDNGNDNSNQQTSCEIKFMNGDVEIPNGGSTSFTANDFVVNLENCEDAITLDVLFVYASRAHSPVNKSVVILDNSTSFSVGTNKDFPLAVGRYTFRVLNISNDEIARGSFDLTGANSTDFTFAVRVTPGNN